MPGSQLSAVGGCPTTRVTLAGATVDWGRVWRLTCGVLAPKGLRLPLLLANNYRLGTDSLGGGPIHNRSMPWRTARTPHILANHRPPSPSQPPTPFSSGNLAHCLHQCERRLGGEAGGGGTILYP